MRTIGAVIFPEFELLDLYGPLEMFGLLSDDFKISIVGTSRPSEISAQGPKTVVDDVFDDNHAYDILLIPGGRGTRKAIKDQAFLDWLAGAIARSEHVAVVCTGTALVARTGLLDDHKATSNKAAFQWVADHGPNVDWQEKARWVHSGKFFTSSGVSAGIDMSLALIAHVLGEDKAEDAAKWAEYDWHRNPDWDPFAEIYGLA